MNEQDKIEWIEQYLQGNLSAEQKASIEQQMNRDQAFREEVEMHRKLEDFFKDQNQIELHNILKEQRQKDDSAHSIHRNLIFRLAAAITLILGVVAIYWLNLDRQSSEELFIAYYEPYPMVLNQRSGNQDEAYRAAINAYQNGEYENALTYFDQLIEQDTLVAISKFYQGVIHLNLKESAAAITKLISVADSKNQLIQQQALWYLGLAYLLEQESEKAISTLQRLQQAGDYKQEEVATILKEIN